MASSGRTTRPDTATSRRQAAHYGTHAVTVCRRPEPIRQTSATRTCLAGLGRSPAGTCSNIVNRTKAPGLLAARCCSPSSRQGLAVAGGYQPGDRPGQQEKDATEGSDADGQREQVRGQYDNRQLITQPGQHQQAAPASQRSGERG